MNGVEKVRMSPLISALSMVLDLSVGQRLEHAIRSCYIGLRLAHKLGLSPEETSDLLYGALLKDVGCTCISARLAQIIAGDELIAKGSIKSVDTDSMRQVMGWLIKSVASGKPLPTRLTRITSVSRSIASSPGAAYSHISQ